MFSLSAKNAKFYCRTCLVNLETPVESVPELVETNEMPAYVNVSTNKRILQLIHTLTESTPPLDEKEDYPKNVCFACFRVLEEFDEFRNSVSECANTLHSIFKNFELADEESVERSAEISANLIDTVFIAEPATSTFNDSIEEVLEKILSNEMESIEEKNAYEDNNFRENVKSGVSYLPHSDEVHLGNSIKNFEQNTKIIDSADNKKTIQNNGFRSGSSQKEFNEKYICNAALVCEEPEELSVKERSFVCDLCDKAYKRIEALRQHLIAAHDSNRRTFKCSVCGKPYKTNAALKHHHLNKHMDKKHSKRHICEFCGAAFIGPKNLATHYIAKHNTGLKFECDLCKKTFQNPFNLQYHNLRYHTMEKHCLCNICGLSFAKKFMLVAHMRVHCPDAEKFQCDQCDRLFIQKCDLDKHYRVVHLKIKPFECTHCNQTFASQKTLQHHVFRHTGEKPYVCDVCEKAFRQPTSMKKHKKEHFADRGPEKRQFKARNRKSIKIK